MGSVEYAGPTRTAWDEWPVTAFGPGALCWSWLRAWTGADMTDLTGRFGAGWSQANAWPKHASPGAVSVADTAGNGVK